jgi:hypothetical protein
MPERPDSLRTLTINRAPVLTLWAAVVAERLGYDRDEAVTLGRAVAGMNAAAKARTLGIARPADKAAAVRKPRSVGPGALVAVELCGRNVPAVKTPAGLRASKEGRAEDPASVHRYLASKFGEALDDVRGAMTVLAKSRSKEQLATEAFALYEAFRPGIPSGVRGWGAKGVLDLDRVRSLAAKGRGTR